MESSRISFQSNVNADSDEEAFLLAYKLATSSILPMVLKSALELNLLEIIKNSGPVTPAELAKQMSSESNTVDQVSIDRILFFLACNSILDCEAKVVLGGGVERRYALTPAAKFLTKNEDGVSLMHFSLITFEAPFMVVWSQLKGAIFEGGVPFNKANGMPFYEYLHKDFRFRNLFNMGMADYSTITTMKLLDSYSSFESFDGISTLVDVGGGNGTTLNMIISKYPHLKGINLDLEHVLRETPSYPGIENVVGDMFESVPKGDAMFLKWILHNWSDEHCDKLLKNCYEALQPNGKLIVVDYILPIAPDLSLATQKVATLDITMFGLTHGGKERTESEFHTLASTAGFKKFRRVCSAYNLLWVMEFTK